jgi:hypothetical protein
MTDEFKAAAQALLNAQASDKTETFDVNGSEDEIVVHVSRRKKLKKLREDSGTGFGKTGISFHGSGAVCTACGGTGRIG